LEEKGMSYFSHIFLGSGGGGNLLPPPEGLICCCRRWEITTIIAIDSSLA
jgi:hypothetical protein